MSQNTGTLISASIRPNNSLDPIASAYASEIKGGLHTVENSIDRDNIILERREWGMMCYVVSLNQTFQLKYNYSSTNILDNSNWVLFNSSGGSGVNWIDPVISIQNSEPISPSDGDRYIMGQTPTGSPAWLSISPDVIIEWNATLNQWSQTTPLNEMSVRVDNEENAIYNYEGNFPTGQWYKEKLGQVRDIIATTINGQDYTSLTNPPIDNYTNDLLFLTKFSTTNLSGTVSLNINGLGSVQVKKPSTSGLSNFNPLEIIQDIVYSLTYDGTYFQLVRPFVNEDIFNVKHIIEPQDYIVVPQYYQYWVYGDLEIFGQLVNYGHVIIANGSLINSGGTFSNFGQLALVNLSTGATTSYNDSQTIEFSYQNTIMGPSVSSFVKQNSLTASYLDTGTSGGPTAGYLLSVNNDGTFKWVDSISATGSGTQSIFESLTKSQADNLISSNSLEPGKIYEITDADPLLYGGTRILLTAVSVNAFSIDGSGIFYIPNIVPYNTSIWNPSSSYFPGTNVIWGGSVWSNINGFTGSYIDEFNLDPIEWTQQTIGDPNFYNEVIHQIKYDYVNDRILYRRDRFDNIVSVDSETITYFEGLSGGANPIKGFQWTNDTNIGSPYNTKGNYIENSLFFNINSRYDDITGNILRNRSFIKNNVNISTSTSITFSYNILDNFSYISDNQFNSSQPLTISKNLLTNESFISNNIFEWGDITSNILEDNSRIVNNSLLLGSTSGQSTIERNKLYGSSIIDGNLMERSNIRNNILNIFSEIKSNSMFAIGSPFFLSTTIEENTLLNSTINNNGLTASSSNTIIDECVLKSECYINNNQITDSILSSNNLMSGSYITNNTLTSNSQVFNNVFESSSWMSDNILSDSGGGPSQINYNTLRITSYIYQNNIDSSLISYNILDNNSRIEINTETSNSEIQFNSLSQNSFISENTLNNVSRVSYNNLVLASNLQLNALDTGSYIEYCMLLNNSLISSNSINSGSRINQNNISGYSSIDSNDLSGVSFIDFNTLEDSYIITNTISSGGFIEHNKCSQDSYIQFNSISSSGISYNIISIQSIILNNNLQTNSFISENDINNSNISNNLLSSTIIQNNQLINSNFDFSPTGTLTSSLISDVFSRNLTSQQDLSTASNIFLVNTTKNIFINSAGTERLSYYDNTDTLIISNVNA